MMSGFKAYALSGRAAWYWITLLIMIITTLAVFVMPTVVFPENYIKSVLGLLFILFLPGFSLFQALFPLKIPFQSDAEYMEIIVGVILSLGLNIALVSLVGLVLYYSPIGLRLSSVYESLFAITLLFATVAFVRKYQIFKISK